VGWRLSGQRAYVVGDEAVHRRQLAWFWSVVGRGDLLAELEPVLLAEDVEQLGVGVRVFLPGVGAGAVHVAGHRVRHHLAVGAVLGPLRDRVGEVLAGHAVEGLAVSRPVQAAEHVIKRPVLEHHHDHVIERVLPALTCHPGPH
jgi:hypothetical protein